MKATGQHQAPIPAPSRDYCGGILLKISKKCLNGLCVNQPAPIGVKPGRCCPGSREHRGKSLQVDLSGLLVVSISLILGCEAVASCPTIESSHATGVLLRFDLSILLFRYCKCNLLLVSFSLPVADVI
jgi:hypothetical protein